MLQRKSKNENDLPFIAFDDRETTKHIFDMSSHRH